MTLVTSNTPGKRHNTQKKVKKGTANVARKSKRSNALAMCGNPLPTDIYFRRAAVAARFSNHTKLDLLAQDFAQLY